MWTLGPSSFRVIDLYEFQIQASTFILTNESGTSTIQIPFVATIKLEPTNDSVFVLSNSKDDICASLDLSNMLSFPLKNVHSTPSQFPMYVVKFPCGPMYKTVFSHISPSQHPPLHPSPSSIGLNMVDALKLTKSRKKFQVEYYIHWIDNIDVCDVKY